MIVPRTLTYARTWKVKQPNLPGPNGTSIPQPDTEDSDNDVHDTGSALTETIATGKSITSNCIRLSKAEMEKLCSSWWKPDYTLASGIYTARPRDGAWRRGGDSCHAAGNGGDQLRSRGGGERWIWPPTVPNDEGLLKGIAEGQTGPPDVKNDALDFTWEGSTTNVMDGSTVVENGPDPTQIPAQQDRLV